MSTTSTSSSTTSSTSADPNTDRVSINHMTEGQLIQAGIEIQQDTLAILNAASKTTETTHQVADDVLFQLAEQRMAIKEAADETKALQAELKKANSELRSFMRRIMTNKLIIYGIVFVWCNCSHYCDEFDEV